MGVIDLVIGRLDDTTLNELHELEEQRRRKAVKTYPRGDWGKQGDQLDVQGDRHGVVEKTIRNWLERFEEQPIEAGPYDAPRPGGLEKIEGQEREQLFEQLQQLPTELGYDQQA